MGKKNKKNCANFAAVKPYEYKGIKNQTVFPEFVELCKKTQNELIDILPQRLRDAGYTDVICEDGFIYARGNIPYLVTAHMDTVHLSVVQDFYEYVDENGRHILSSPQGIGGDDRCGIYMILEIIKEFKPYVLFCEDEESGMIGAKKFVRTKYIDEFDSDIDFMIELDRAHANDAVFYDCDNPEFTAYILENTKYEKDFGTFSDISTLAPMCGVAGVNLSCGYYKPHTLQEEVVVEEMLNTIVVVKRLLSSKSVKYEYIEKEYLGYAGGWGYDWSGCDGFWSANDVHEYILYDAFSTLQGTEGFDTVTGYTEEQAWLDFFQKNPNTCWNDVLDYYVDRI